MVKTYFEGGGVSVDKEHKSNDKKPEILLGFGSMLVSLNSFFDGFLLEKIAVLIGLVFMIISSILIIKEHKGKNKKGIIIFFSFVGLISTGIFLGLLYRLIFA